MNDLRILIARLGWPSPFARWWTMQELATRLGEPAAKAETESGLLQLLRSRKLEAEIVEILCIFWMAANGFGYSPTANLVECILKPSPLSDLLVKGCGLPIKPHNSNLKKVSEDFDIPEDFIGVQGVDFPPIFLTSAEGLEAYSKRPFVRQMAFEWAENWAAYSNAPYQGDLGYFIRPLGDDFTGQFSARSALRAISAYLRTLMVAKQFWNMPPALVDQESLLALPVHPTLALLKPCRPDWFPMPTDFDGDTNAIETSIRTLLARMEAERPGDELIAFSSPVVMSMERCVEVSLVRWSKKTGGIMENADLADHLDPFWTQRPALSSKALDPLNTVTVIIPPTLDQLMDKECKSWPLASTLDFGRIGYLQYDLYPSRLFLPTMPSTDKIEITPHGGQIQAKVKDQTIADFYFWNVGWQLARPARLGGNCGTALISHGTTYREAANDTSETLFSFYLWKVRTLQKNNRFDKFNETLTVGTVFV